MSTVSQSTTVAAGATRPTGSKSAWSPLLIPLFRALWIATVISNIGTWAQEAGGPWLMHILTKNNVMLGLLAAAANLPICLLSLPAGALADVLDRRRLLIFTQLWMLSASGMLGILTLLGWASPAMLLAFTFLLGIGTALSGPAFQAIVPELVPPADMRLAVGLNSVALNVARAIGPALGMLVVALADWGARSAGPQGEARGPGASFVLNALSFVGVAWVLYRWNRPHSESHIHKEDLLGAVRTGFRYTRYSPAMQAVLVRVALFITCAVVMWSQLPSIAQDQLHIQKVGYGILMGCLGAGAVAGVFLMPELERRLNVDGMVTACTAMFALGLLLLSQVRWAWLADLLMLFIGLNWVIIPTNFNIATQRSVPGWVKGRALSMYMTTLFGTWALGSAAWGWVAHRTSISTAMFSASLLMLAGLALVRRFPLTLNAGHDLSPAKRGPAAAAPDVGGHRGAVQVVIEYVVAPDRVGEFAAVMRNLRLQRLRNGASQWRLDRAAAGDGQFIEKFDFESWNEHVRHHGRMTKEDASLESAVYSFHIGNSPPAVHCVPLAGPPEPVPWHLKRADFGMRIIEEYALWHRRLATSSSPRSRAAQVQRRTVLRDTGRTRAGAFLSLFVNI